MSYRPQFAYATPPGCRDEDFVYYFDGSNVPLLVDGVSSGVEIPYIPLPLDQDAPFYWRGWKVGLQNSISSGCPVVTTVAYKRPDLDIRLRDCYQNYLMDAWVPAVQSGFAQNPLSFRDELMTGYPVPLEPEIYCPRGGYLELFLRGGASLLGTNLVSLSLYGVKRFKECNE